MQYTEIFLIVKIEDFHWKFFYIFNRLAKAVLTSTHSLCFGSKMQKIGIPLHTPVLLYKSGVKGVICVTDMFSTCHRHVILMNVFYKYPPIFYVHW